MLYHTKHNASSEKYIPLRMSIEEHKHEKTHSIAKNVSVNWELLFSFLFFSFYHLFIHRSRQLYNIKNTNVSGSFEEFN